MNKTTENTEAVRKWIADEIDEPDTFHRGDKSGTVFQPSVGRLRVSPERMMDAGLKPMLEANHVVERIRNGAWVLATTTSLNDDPERPN
jgi:hypothetical protein